MRQDRYLVFRNSPRLAAFFASFHRILCQHSFQMLTDGSTTPPSVLGFDPLLSRSNVLKYKESLHRAVTALIGRSQTQTHAESSKYEFSNSETSDVRTGSGQNEFGSGKWSQIESGPHADPEMTMKDKQYDTVVFPLLQLGLYGINQDELAMQELLQRVEPGETVLLASGYFNLPPSYLEAILSSRGEYLVLAASPQVRIHPVTTGATHF